MKLIIEKKEQSFKPIDITIRFESEQEIANFLARINKNIDKDSLLGSLPQYGYWCSSPIQTHNFEFIGRGKFSSLVDSIGTQIGWRKV